MQTQSGKPAGEGNTGIAEVAAVTGAPSGVADTAAISRRLAMARRTLLAAVRAGRLFLLSVEVLLWSVFFVVAILFLALRYLVLPNVENYREEIVAEVSEAVGLKVSIDRISADWRGLRPQLDLVNVRLHDSNGREALVLPSVVNVISWSSLLFLDLRLHSFAVDDLKLSVRRDAQGRLTVAGIQIERDVKNNAGEGRLTDWVLGQREILLRNAEVEWLDDMRGAPALKLSALHFRLQNDGDVHSVGLSARPPRELAASIDFRAELVGRSVTEPHAWNGRLFAEVGNTDLAAWRAWIDYPADVKSGVGAVRAWVTLAEGKLRRFSADLALARVVAELGKDLPALQLASLRGQLSGRLTAQGFELATRELRVTDEHGHEMRPTTLRLAVDHAQDGAGMKGAFSANLLEFAPLAHVAEALPLPAGMRRLLLEVAPLGNLIDASFDWRGDPARPDSFTVRTRFTDLGMKPRGRIPGFAGLTGAIDANEKKGTLYLASKDTEIDLPRVFKASRTRLDTLSGQVSWEDGRENPASAGPLKFKYSNLSFANADFAGTAFGTYTYTGKGPGLIDLSANLSRGEVKQVPRYAPLLLSAGLRAWLDGAVLGGLASEVRVLLRGDLFDFPFANRSQGQFQVAGKVRQGVLDYADGWPRLENIDADVLFERDRAEFVGRKAGIFGTLLSGVRVSIPSFADRTISISGQAEGLTADFLRFTQQSPVRRMVSQATDQMQATGRGTLRLKLDLPLVDMTRSRVAGQYQFNANNVVVDARLPPLERANGRIDFSENGFVIQDVRGALFGGQVVVTGGTRPEGGVLVTARGEASVSGLRVIFDHPWRRFLSGVSPYTARVTVANNITRVVFESPLTGVTSELPYPLAKSAQETLPLRVEIVPVDGGDSISVTLAKTVSAEFQRRREGGQMLVMRTGVGLNQPTRLPDRNGLMLAGTLPTLNLDRWLPLITGSEPGGPAQTAGGKPASGQSPAGSAAPGPASAVSPVSTHASTIELKLGTLDAFGKRINAVNLRAGADVRGWQASIASNEIAGELNYRDEGRGKLTARLAHFTPPADYPGARSRSGARELPAVDLIAERFNYRGKHLGRVEVTAQPEGADWRIEKIANVNPEAALSGKGLWVTGAQSRTSLDFTLNVNDAGKYLDRVGTPDTVKGGSAKLAGSLSWAGDPLNIDYPTLTGQVSLEAENGQFQEIEPGIGKLVSLMSLQMLPRRIALDFRDVFSKGFAFDRITSSLNMQKGVINTKDFRMRGPAAEVAIEGDADVANETQNLRVKVVPALGDTASTIVGLLNPAYGVASLIAQKLLKNPLGNIFAFEYAVSGKWSDPKVTKLGVAPVEAVATPGEVLR